LRASLQCDTHGDRALSAHTTPSASNARASTEETASAGRCRGRPRGAKNRSWQGDPTRYGSAHRRRCLSRNLLLN
jgi:hypothetical protein